MGSGSTIEPETCEFGGRRVGRKMMEYLKRLRFLNCSTAVVGCLLVALAVNSALAQEPAATTIVVVRHAEKMDSSRDPDLAPEGRDRAERLRDLLEESGTSQLFATQFKRTQQTLEPLGERLGVPVSIRQAQALRELVQEVLAEHSGETVVVAGHSDTVPRLIEMFGGPSLDPLTEDDYDNLFILFVAPDSSTRLIRLIY